jgi:hypothetical protein
MEREWNWVTDYTQVHFYLQQWGPFDIPIGELVISQWRWVSSVAGRGKELVDGDTKIYCLPLNQSECLGHIVFSLDVYIPNSLWNRKVNYSVHEGPPAVLVLRLVDLGVGGGGLFRLHNVTIHR